MNSDFPLYQHTKRPEWGYCAITEVREDRTTFKFADGESRSISSKHLHMMVIVEPEEADAIEIRRRIGKHAPSRPPIAGGKSKSKSKSKKAPAKLAAP